jgi:hypothetical protein
MVRILLRCPKPVCRASIRVEASPGDHAQPCHACGHVVTLHVDKTLASGQLERCPACTAQEFFTRRDFNQRLGLLVVVVAAVVSCVFVALNRMPMGWAVLAGAVVIDALLYLVTGMVTVCYGCGAEFRGLSYNPAHKAFDLATSEKYG